MYEFIFHWVFPFLNERCIIKMVASDRLDRKRVLSSKGKYVIMYYKTE